MDCIEILDDDAEVVVEDDDDDVRVIEEPLPKRSRTDTPHSGTKRQERTTTSPVPEDPKTSKEVLHFVNFITHKCYCLVNTNQTS